MPAPKSRQGGPGSAGPALKHVNPTVAERKVEFEVSVARHTLLADVVTAPGTGHRSHASCGVADMASGDSPPMRPGWCLGDVAASHLFDHGLHRRV